MKPKPKVVLTVHRYGLEVVGGAEYLCRYVADLMKDDWDIRVLTTCARDYMTWKNEYPAGEQCINGINVIRFPVRKPRNVSKFNKISERVFSSPHPVDDEVEWMQSQGPDVPELFNYIKRIQQNVDVFIFFTYLYQTTFIGLPLVPEKACLVPTAHDEPPIHLGIFRYLFEKPQGYIFCTPEEQHFVEKLFNIDCKYSDVIGIGINSDESTKAARHTRVTLPDNFVVYVGRVDPSKGCQELLHYWQGYKTKTSGDLKLVLIGDLKMDLPKRNDILPLGYLEEADKFYAISNSQCLIMPSPYESLSIVLLEAWLCRRPVLVNGKCEVLKGQCRRSNGGLWYDNFEEFEAGLNFILKQKQKARQLAENGHHYTAKNYNPASVRQKYRDLIHRFLERKISSQESMNAQFFPHLKM